LAVVYYVEHGDTKYDVNDCAQGWIDDGLTAKGRAQAARAGRALKGTKIDCVYTSPMKRAKQTAEIICKILGAEIVVLPRLKPLDIGSLAGKKNSQVKPYLGFYSTRPSLKFPDGESFGSYYDRVRKEWIHQFADDDPEIAVVSHARDWQFLKHWAKNGLDADLEGVQFNEPTSAQVAKLVKSGNSVSMRKIA